MPKAVAPVVGEPVGQIQNDARIEAGFEYAEQKSQRVKRRRRLHEHRRNRCQAPADRDAHDGLPGADPLQQQVAWHLEEEVAEKENAGAEAIDRLAPFQIVEHRELDEADVDTIDPCQHPQQHQEGDKALKNLAIYPVQLSRCPRSHTCLPLPRAGAMPAQSERWRKQIPCRQGGGVVVQWPIDFGNTRVRCRPANRQRSASPEMSCGEHRAGTILSGYRGRGSWKQRLCQVNGQDRR